MHLQVPRLISAQGILSSQGERQVTVATLKGQHFQNLPTAACRFGTGDSMPATFVSTTAMTCKIPEFPKTTPQMSVCVTLDGTACSDEYQLKIYAVAAVFPTALPRTGGLLRVTLNGLHEPSEVGSCSDGACVKVRFKGVSGWIANGLVKEFNTTKLGNTFVIAAPDLNQGKQQLEVSLNQGLDYVGGVFVQVYDVPQGTCIPSGTDGSLCAYLPVCLPVLSSHTHVHTHMTVISTLPCAGPVSGGSVVLMRSGQKAGLAGFPCMCGAVPRSMLPCSTCK